MAQIVYSGHARICPSEAVLVTGTTEAGRELEIFIRPSDVEVLRKAFALADKYGIHTGHAYWHIMEGRAIEDCLYCMDAVKNHK